MAKIKVHILNFHGPVSHIELVLENTTIKPHTYYGINRWEEPKSIWSIGGPKQYIEEASSIYSFDIEANPHEIINRWRAYWYGTYCDAHITSNNCADASQWFLTEFARIPEPNLSNVSWNHFLLGIVWPSFIPCPVSLPGRTMSNAKFHIEARTNPQIANQYSRLFLYTSMALTALMVAASIFTLTAAATILSGVIASIAIASCAVIAAASTYGFFRAHNALSSKKIAEELKKTEGKQHDSLKSNESEPLLARVCNVI